MQAILATSGRTVALLLSRIAAVLFVLAFASASGAADLPRKFDPSRNAAVDISRATSLARAQGKRVIVDVGGEWCAWCHIMDRFVAANPDVRALVDANFIWLKVNFSPENRNEGVLSRWPPVDGYPHLFVLDASGELLHSQDTGELEAGKGYDKPRFRAFLERWAPPRAPAGRT
jgi:thioredoxin-related protein